MRTTKWHKAGARESEWSDWKILVAIQACLRWSQHFEEQQFRNVLVAFGARTNRGYDGQDCEGRVPKLTGACSAASPTDGARLEPLVVGGSSGSHDVICSIPGGGLLKERPQVDERGQNERRHCSVRWKVIQLRGQL